VADVIDYHRAPSQAERETARRQWVERRDKTIRRLVIVFILFIIAVTISLYTLPSHFGDAYSWPSNAAAPTSQP
jgi:hypothetical protein